MKKLIVAVVMLMLSMGAIFAIQWEDLAVSSGPNLEDYDLPRAILKTFDTSALYEVTFEAEGLQSHGINMDPLPIDYEVSLLSVGDIMAHTIQFQAAERPGGYDFYPQFAFVADKIESQDFAIGNFETVMAGQDKRYSGKNMIFNAPDNLGESLKKAGFDIMATANNHSLDRGYYGIKRTLDVFDDLGMMTIGTARDAGESEKILFFEKNQMRFAMLSYSFSTNGWPMPEDHPYALSMMEEDKILQDIKRARSQADFVLVAVHWGLEYHLEENHHQRNLAQSMMYAGADIILGHHPHVIQPFEHVTMVDVSGEPKDKFIIYSQGNFVSGQRTFPRAIGMYIDFTFKRHSLDDPYVAEVSVMPTYVEDTYKNGQRYMRVLETIDRKALLDEGEINESLFYLLEQYETTFVEHIASRVTMRPYLNDEQQFVIYEAER